MAGVFNNGQWVPFQDQMGRQGWYNQATGQMTYQMYGGYNGNPMLQQQGQIPIQPQMYQQPPMQVPIGYVPQVPQQMAPQIAPQIAQVPPMPQMPQQVPGNMSGWQTLVDRNGRRYYHNPVTGQNFFY